MHVFDEIPTGCLVLIISPAEFVILGIPQLCFLDFFRDYPDNSSRSCSFTWGMMIPQLFDCEDFFIKSHLLRIDKLQIYPMGSFHVSQQVARKGSVTSPDLLAKASPADSLADMVGFLNKHRKKMFPFGAF